MSLIEEALRRVQNQTKGAPTTPPTRAEAPPTLPVQTPPAPPAPTTPTAHSWPVAASTPAALSPLEVSPTYLTAEEVGDMLQVSVKSVYRWAKSDPTFPMLKLGGTVRFPRERLLRWLRDVEQGRPRPRMRRQLLSASNPA